MNTKDLPVLKINNLTQAQYESLIASGNVSSDEIYLTPDDGAYATVEQLDTKADLNHTHDINISDVTDLQSTLDSKSDSTHKHNISDVTNLQSTLNGKAPIDSPSFTSMISMGRTYEIDEDEIAHVGYNSVAFGTNVAASGTASFAEGSDTVAHGICSHAGGFNTTALDYQHAQGHYNNTSNATAGTNSGTGSGSAFVIGNGTSSSASNAFRVTYDGKPYSKSTMVTSGCDYAEFFEWQDLNPNSEDRRGYFVTLDGDKIKIAEPNDYILGIISGMPSVVGNGDEDWTGRYVFDEFGAFVYEDFEYEEDIPEVVVDEETGENSIVIRTVTKTGKRYKENPDYDPTIGYIQREDRPEWDAVGMLGVLSVRDDGTCYKNGYCTVAEGGIATASETGYRVIKRVNENIVKVVFR